MDVLSGEFITVADIAFSCMIAGFAIVALIPSLRQIMPALGGEYRMIHRGLKPFTIP
jgi:hypothetical protein